MKLEDYKKAPRIEQATHMLENFCKDFIEEGPVYSDKWETNVNLIKMYAEEIVVLLKKREGGNNNE
tara:strand:+ start:2950 stop:3147 length:198 start_codon:yes stop_codon:yes gene_type:complete